MSQAMLDLDETDYAILAELAEGRGTPTYIGEQVGVTRQTVQNRLKPLRAGGYVRKIGRGLYEITDEGRTALADEHGE